MSATLDVVGLRKTFDIGSWLSRRLGRPQTVVVAVDDISFTVRPGEALGIVGESGSGKSVTAQMISRLEEPTEGMITYGGADINRLEGEELLAYRRAVQIVFQNPYDALNPARRIYQSLIEPLQVHRTCPKSEYRSQALSRLVEVGLIPAEAYIDRYPHELSGGEVQRVAIARSLMLDPELIVADEPTSMLDVSVRAGVLNLLRDLRRSRGLSMVFISHDFSTIRYLCDRTAVMQAGEIVEIGDTREVIDRRLHPYSDALLSAVPVPGDGLMRERVILTGPRHDPTSDVPGCRYVGRCPRREAICFEARPALREVAPGHQVSCHVVGKGEPASTAGVEGSVGLYGSRRKEHQ